MGTDSFQIMIHGTADEATRFGLLCDIDTIARRYSEQPSVEFKAVDLGIASTVAPFTYPTEAEIAEREEEARLAIERAEQDKKQREAAAEIAAARATAEQGD